jgi:hypothetical protein
VISRPSGPFVESLKQFDIVYLQTLKVIPSSPASSSDALSWWDARLRSYLNAEVLSQLKPRTKGSIKQLVPRPFHLKALKCIKEVTRNPDKAGPGKLSLPRALEGTKSHTQCFEGSACGHTGNGQIRLGGELSAGTGVRFVFPAHQGELSSSNNVGSGVESTFCHQKRSVSGMLWDVLRRQKRVWYPHGHINHVLYTSWYSLREVI